MLNKTQDPVLPALMEETGYVEARRRELRAKAENPYAMDFLYCLYEKLLDQVLAELSDERRSEVDTLVMLCTYIERIKYDDLTGFELIGLSEAVADATHLVKWEGWT